MPLDKPANCGVLYSNYAPNVIAPDTKDSTMKSPELIELDRALRRSRDQQPDSVSMRRTFATMLAERTSNPAGLKVETVTAGGRPADRLTFADHADDGVLLYLHGGGYAVCSPFTHRALAANLGRASGLNALVPDYRLAPEHPFPAAVDDAVAVYRGLLEAGTPPERIAIAGDSAGGGLTLATMLSVRDAGDPLPGAAALISPWTDLAVTGESVKTRQKDDPMLYRSGLIEHAEMYLGDGDRKHPLASPLYADLSGLPPLIIHVGTAEILLDDATRLAERATAAGVDVSLHLYEDMMHVWHYFEGMLPESGAAIEQIGQFIKANIVYTEA